MISQHAILFPINEQAALLPRTDRAVPLYKHDAQVSGTVTFGLATRLCFVPVLLRLRPLSGPFFKPPTVLVANDSWGDRLRNWRV